jgi:dTDP-4-amino-4,6-dideoxygalactose transaminase
MSYLTTSGIGTGIHYPVPLHLQKAYAALDYSAGDFPVAESVAAEIVSLPMFPHLTDLQQVRVADEIRTFTSQSARGHENTTNRKLVSAEKGASVDYDCAKTSG